ncbi:hypothetical protein TNCT_348991 [Trichonephila clavata]|uniref:Uncharacterized protein n=1 Tax=Trichonephila clavata TaxID=2740835 RepID=A0A8X6I296_TRICU|nr:hypothetical protein TNCT_348991 [Trichonephila clavata]
MFVLNTKHIRGNMHIGSGNVIQKGIYIFKSCHTWLVYHLEKPSWLLISLLFPYLKYDFRLKQKDAGK